jgi:hypothetical protein
MFLLNKCTYWSWDSSVGIAVGYGLEAGARFPAWARDFSFLHNVQTDSEALPASYPMGTEDSFLGGTAAGVGKLTTHLHVVSRSRMVEL